MEILYGTERVDANGLVQNKGKRFAMIGVNGTSCSTGVVPVIVTIVLGGNV